MAIKYSLQTKSSGSTKLGSINLNPEGSDIAKYRANNAVPGSEIIPYEAQDENDANLKAQGKIFVKVIKKPKPCKYQNSRWCKDFCTYNDWLAAAQAWFNKFRPGRERHRGWRNMWYWFPDFYLSPTSWPKRNVFRVSGHQVSSRYMAHLRRYEIPKAMSSHYNFGRAKPNQGWLVAEWSRLWNCYKEIKGIRETLFWRFDPIAQTFSTDEQMVCLTGIGVYFAETGNAPITVFLQETTNGYPNSGKILTKKILQPSEIQTSKDASKETIFYFDDLIYLNPKNEYSICIFSPDPMAKVFVATMGEPDLETKNIITKQPAAGVFFQSPNNSTWIASPRTDLKFKLYTAQFDNISEDRYIVEFDTVSGISFSVFNFDVPTVIPEGTKLIPEYSLDGGMNWKRFELGENIELDKIYTSIKIRVILLGNTEISPIVKEAGSLKLMKYRPQGRYIIRTLETLDNFENCRILFMANIPPNTSITPYYSLDDGETWTEITNYTTVNLDGIWTEYDFKKENIFPAVNKLKMKIEMNTSDLSKTPKIKDIRMLLY